MPILNYTTKIETYKTIGEIQSILVKHGAKKIMQEYDENSHICALSFVIDTPLGVRGIKLPARVENVQKVLHKQKVKDDYEQAERVAWRDVKDWVEAQMAMLETEQVSMDEVFFQYMLRNDGSTVFEAYKNNQLMLGSGGVE